jgi:hypothetical protein
MSHERDTARHGGGEAFGGLTSCLVSPVRRCSRTACALPAVATLTYVYAASTAVVGPLATYAEPHTYDLCEAHAQRLTAPRGWEVVRHEPDPEQTRIRSNDDLEALADAVREAARPAAGKPGLPETSGRRGHLRAVPTPL